MGVRGTQALRVAAEAIRFDPTRAWPRDRLGLNSGSAELLLARKALARGDWSGAETALLTHFLQRRPRFLIDPAARCAFSAAARARFPSCVDDSVCRAAPLLDGRYDLLGYKGLSFRTGDAPVDWHLDPVHGRRAPVRFWARVPYLDSACGDHKIIWELNRHQHWLALGRAAWLTGDQIYAAAFVTELKSWLRANPPLAGINWSSMLEVAFRSLSWIWALHLFVPLEAESDSLWLLDLLAGLERQLEHVSRHLSYYFSPNTHLLGEGLSLYVAGRVLPELRSAARWERSGRAILLREIRAQVNADGGHAELSLHYHRYALDFYLLALAVARRTGDAAAAPFADVVARLASFCRALADDDGRLPTIGDDDGGLLFPMCGRAPADARDSLCLAAAFLGNPELAVGEPPEEAFWMLGGDSTLLVQPRPREPRCELFPDSGYAVLRSPGEHAILDGGPHGFLNGGHAHADALSLVLSVKGRPLLIDPGTATYTTDRVQRDRFRSTAMHNTAVVDGRSQSETAGPFHWASRANARVIFWRPAPRGGTGTHTGSATVAPAPAHSPKVDYVEAEHDGYLPLVHRRGVLRVRDGLWLVADHILGSGHHHAELYWHLDPAWTPDGPAARFTHPDGLQAAIASTAGTRQQFQGDAEGLGWCAPVYGRLVPSLTLRFSDAAVAPRSVVTAIAAATSPIRMSLKPLAVTADQEDGWHRCAIAARSDEALWLALFATPPVLPGQHGTRGRGPAHSWGTALTDERSGGRSSHRFALGDGELATDARVAVLRLSDSGAPVSLSLVEASMAAWTGPDAFSLAPAAVPMDVHLDRAALRQLAGGLAARR